MEIPTEFTFFWRDGKRDVFEGTSPADALNKVGYGGGVIKAIDFYSPGDDKDWEWNAEEREWHKKE